LIVNLKEQKKIDSLIEILKKDSLSTKDKEILQEYKDFFEKRKEKAEKLYKTVMRDLQLSLNI